MWAALIVFGLILFTVGYAVYRLADMRQLPAWIWVVLLATAAVPAWSGYTVLYPGEPVAELELAGLHAKGTLQVPEGHTIMVTGNLGDPDKPESGKTNYRLDLIGDGWTQQLPGEIRRKVDSGLDFKVEDGDKISEKGSRKAGRWGEELEQRFDIEAPGLVDVEVGLWQGGAADSLRVMVVHAPPPPTLMWVLFGVVALVGLVAEARYGAVQVGGDLAFLVLFAIFLRDKVTPADALQEAAGAAFGSAIIGWGVFGGLSWIVLKVQDKLSKKDVVEAEPEAPSPAPRGKRRR